MKNNRLWLSSTFVITTVVIIVLSLGLSNLVLTHAASSTLPKHTKPQVVSPHLLAALKKSNLHFNLTKQARDSITPKSGVTPLISSPPVTYGGGHTMHSVTVHTIYWDPPKLQSGTSTGMISVYQPVIDQFMKDLGGTDYYKTLSQYYDNYSGHTDTSLTFGNNYFDRTNSYQASQCSDSAVPHPTDCILDASIQDEIGRAITANPSWGSGYNNFYLVYTNMGEGVCYVNGSTCSYTSNCGYHDHSTTIHSTNEYIRFVLVGDRKGEL